MNLCLMTRELELEPSMISLGDQTLGCNYFTRSTTLTKSFEISVLSALLLKAGENVIRHVQR